MKYQLYKLWLSLVLEKDKLLQELLVAVEQQRLELRLQIELEHKQPFAIGFVTLF